MSSNVPRSKNFLDLAVGDVIEWVDDGNGPADGGYGGIGLPWVVVSKRSDLFTKSVEFSNSVGSWVWVSLAIPPGTTFGPASTPTPAPAPGTAPVSGTTTKQRIHPVRTLAIDLKVGDVISCVQLNGQIITSFTNNPLPWKVVAAGRVINKNNVRTSIPTDPFCLYFIDTPVVEKSLSELNAGDVIVESLERGVGRTSVASELPWTYIAGNSSHTKYGTLVKLSGGSVWSYLVRTTTSPLATATEDRFPGRCSACGRKAYESLFFVEHADEKAAASCTAKRA